MTITSYTDVDDGTGRQGLRLVEFQCDGPDCTQRTTMDPRLPLSDPQESYDWGTVEQPGGFSAPDDAIPATLHFHSLDCLKAKVATL